MEDIELYLARYDKDKDRRIRFSEFASSFSPIDPYYNDKINARKAGAQSLQNKTIMMYRNLWLS
jgi:hypothetical protein